MPFVRISLTHGKSDALVRAIADGVHQAMIATIDVPAPDRFQVIHEVGPNRLIADSSYLGIQRSSDVVVVEISLHRGRSDAKKQALHHQIADNLFAVGVRREDVLVILHDTSSADWSFGNGEAQVLKPGFRAHWADS